MSWREASSQGFQPRAWMKLSSGGGSALSLSSVGLPALPARGVCTCMPRGERSTSRERKSTAGHLSLSDGNAEVPRTGEEGLIRSPLVDFAAVAGQWLAILPLSGLIVASSRQPMARCVARGWVG